MYRVGSKHDLIDGWFISENIQRVTTHFISVVQIDKRNELALDKTVKIISGD